MNRTHECGGRRTVMSPKMKGLLLATLLTDSAGRARIER